MICMGMDSSGGRGFREAQLAACCPCDRTFPTARKTRCTQRSASTFRSARGDELLPAHVWDRRVKFFPANCSCALRWGRRYKHLSCYFPCFWCCPSWTQVTRQRALKAST
eukprot:scpid29792/ scgid20975/ 